MNKYVSGGFRDHHETERARSVLEWDGTLWRTLDNELCDGRIFHTTAVYGEGTDNKR